MVLNLKAQLLKSMSIESIKLALSEGKKGGGGGGGGENHPKKRGAREN